VFSRHAAMILAKPRGNARLIGYGRVLGQHRFSLLNLLFVVSVVLVREVR